MRRGVSVKLLKLEWPNAPKYLLTFDRHNPAVLADVLEQNRFRMVVIPALTRSFDEQYKEYIGFGKGALKRHRPSIDRILAAMKSAVEDEGAVQPHATTHCDDSAPCFALG